MDLQGALPSFDPHGVGSIVSEGMERVKGIIIIIIIIIISPSQPDPPPVARAERWTQRLSAHTYLRSTFCCTDESPLPRSSSRECNSSADTSFRDLARRTRAAPRGASCPPLRPSWGVFVPRPTFLKTPPDSRVSPLWHQAKTFLPPLPEPQRGEKRGRFRLQSVGHKASPLLFCLVRGAVQLRAAPSRSAVASVRNV